ncbi:hypothetical protein [Granulicella sp. dw_53]|uniref:hypothetical protein n=1 Tax=Granulicella sp. dw_53 TaxID=2719792 RepID=UPI001BD59226|nr:hypothetical protein [Granulicella sp. dw_53]
MIDTLADLITTKLDMFVQTQFATEDVLAKEQKLRPALIKAVRNDRTASYELGRLLNEYQKLFPGGLSGLSHALCISRSTANRARNRYRRANQLPEQVRELALIRGFDVAAPENAYLLKALTENVSEGLSGKEIESAVDEKIAAMEKVQLQAKEKRQAKAAASRLAKNENLPTGDITSERVEAISKPVFLSMLVPFVDQVLDMGLSKKQGLAVFAKAWDDRHGMGIGEHTENT